MFKIHLTAYGYRDGEIVVPTISTVGESATCDAAYDAAQAELEAKVRGHIEKADGPG